MQIPDEPRRTPLSTIGKPGLSVLFVVYLVGCMSTQVAPIDAIDRIRRIAVIPIHMPLTVTPALMQAAFEAKTGPGINLPPSVGAQYLAPIVLLYVLLVEWPKQEDRRNRALELWAKWAAAKDPWNPEQVLAEDAAAMFRRDSAYKDVRVHQAVALPGVESVENTWHMENWMKPRRAWYGRTDSLLNVGEVKALDADAILEIAAGPIEVSSEHIFLHVAVKLISTSSNEVVARSNCVGYTNAAPIEEIFKNEGQLFKSIYSTLSGGLLDQCLRETGLLQ